ncbi:MAG: hypothetical protein F6J87_25425 [Spirulina sp. SIO3F2]|nr:hypothetical protein [Spirulina sp. SIO3F2]
MKLTALGSSLLCATALLCAMPTIASAQNLVRNGGFEDYGLNNRKWKHYGANSAMDFGWTPTGGSRIEIRNNVAGTAFEGKHYAELDSHAYNRNAEEIGLFQDIVTEIGQKYTLSFNFGPREQARVNGDNLFSASFGDFYQEFDAGNYRDGWQSFSTTITATSELTRLKFLSLGKRDTYGANIDNVRLETATMPDAEAVPEPFSMLTVAVAGAIGVQAKRMKGKRK